MYGIFWSVLTRPEYKDETVAFLQDDAAWSLAHESGTLRFEVYEDSQDANRIWVYEAYTDPDAFLSHRSGGYFARWAQEILPRCIVGGVEPAMRWAYSLEPDLKPNG